MNLITIRQIRFKVNYESLKDFISKAPVNMECYNAIWEEFNNLYCNDDAEQILIKKLWDDFMFRFRDVLTITI
ncbi:MAG TPA: hypothetical protein VMV77_04680 [Bacteroidales bacterium]|nr:hypothetical protein [Bacteroidales bacterium]